DSGPRVEGKGAYIRTTNWIPLTPTHDYNFCIKGIAISLNPSGTNENNVPSFVNNLGNNYPNPFNPTTNISFSIEENGLVSLKIYNIRGQLIKTLVSENLDAGVHTMVWDGKDNNSQSVSSGIYLYKMKAGGRYTSTKKMILMK
ncbi:MAG: T9SS type A sorting domain-containing protein, partial [Candidatus Cloacimonetes bacterium]|nr:T9SS type A sorting domain-containing protein [Candidatus Cloacimonadota bacterium]